MADLSEAQSSQSIKIVGASGTGVEDNNYAHVTSDNKLKVEASFGVNTNSGNQDFLSRLRVSQLDILQAWYFASTDHATQFNTSSSGGGTTTFNSNLASKRLTVGTTNGDNIIVQGKRYLRYTPGRSHLVHISGIVGAKKTNVRQRWGFFDANDGFFFEQTGTDLNVVVRSSTSGSPVDDVISQSSWNLDPLDGTGPSGLTLDTSKHNLYIMDFIWHGAGGVRFGVILDNNTIVYAHIYAGSNIRAAPWIRTPNNPIRVELTNTGTSASTTNLDFICTVVQKESTDPLFVPYKFSASRGTSAASVNTSGRAVLSIRPKTSFNSLTNRVPILPTLVQVMTSSDDLYCQIFLNATLTGASFTSVNANSATEFDTAATTVTGGTLLYEFYVPSSNKSSETFSQKLEQIVLGLNIAGTTADIFTIRATSLGGGNISTFAAMNWEEYQ